MRKPSWITATDQFCGAGGSSLGAVAAGAEVVLALNHWTLAVQTHHTNFPQTVHECTDISACDPRRYPSTDILITSPECTNHSQAKGKKRTQQAQLDLWQARALDPAEERSRATMWDVPRFCEVHDYNLVIVENVVEARNWRLFDAWLKAMHDLDYRWELVYFNSMFAHPTPQSRDRMYVVFWKQGNRAPDLRFCPPAYCPTCETDVAAVQSWKDPQKRWGRYGSRRQYVYRCPSLTCAREVHPYYYAAANAIDWRLPMVRIGDRARPLKARTLQRIRLGMERFAGDPFVLIPNDRPVEERSVLSSLPTQTTTQRFALAMPSVIELGHGTHHQGTVRAVTYPLPTQTTAQSLGVLLPSRGGPGQPHDPALVTPFLLDLLWDYRTRAITEPLSTVVAGGNHQGLVLPPPAPSPFLISYYGQDAVRPVTAPVGTMTTIDRHALVSSTSASLAVEECAFRMLQAHEVGRAMAFPESYVVLGDSRQKVKQYGNAVTPPVMQMLLERCIATLA